MQMSVNKALTLARGHEGARGLGAEIPNRAHSHAAGARGERRGGTGCRELLLQPYLF